MNQDSRQLKQWKSNFGREYTDRNPTSLSDLENLYQNLYGLKRSRMNRLFLEKLDRSIRILEIGANIGLQLICLQEMGFKNLYGIEPLEYAVQRSKEISKNINIIQGNAFDLPFRKGYFDLVFTSGVLIHISPKDIHKALTEIYRCSRKFIWGFEYYAKKYQEIPYRGKKEMLWKADYPGLYIKSFPELKLRKIKFFKYIQNNNQDVMFLLEK